jgi:DNA-binding NtrC family response regulator
MLSNHIPIHADPDVTQQATIPFTLHCESRHSAQQRSGELTFQSKLMAKYVRLAERFADSTASVLITGESGTGKELFSRLIHKKSRRRNSAFVAVNCAATAESLMESEFFGHQRGAFTGAFRDKAGHFELASGGTLLLDEISEVPVGMQAKLLRVIEEQEVQPLGSTKPRPIDVRIVATSNKDLAAAVKAGLFRSDLLHRLNVVELEIPPLRERTADIPLLTMHFIEMFKDQSKTSISQVTKQAMSLLCHYPWPGNVRELRNVIHRSCIIADNGTVDADTLPHKLRDASAHGPQPPESSESNVDAVSSLSLAAIERRVIMARLHKFKGDKKEAAKELGVTARTLSNKLRTYHSEGHLSDL